MGKRKSCDLCTLKKIKCDGETPRCSRCIAHGSQCLWTPGIHKRVRGGIQKQGVVSRTTEASHPLVQLSKRLSELEKEVTKLRTMEATEPTRPGTTSLLGASDRIAASALSWTRSPDKEATGSPKSKKTTLRLPPLVETQRIVNNYFGDFNSYIPLFDATSFSLTLQDWYSRHNWFHDDDDDEATWATINIVLALGVQSRLQQDPSDASERNRNEKLFLDNAQSALDRLAMRTKDVKGLQVLLGLVFYIQRSSDPNRAQFLVAAAVKLAYRLGLHIGNNASSASSFGPQASMERSRLFWIVYIADRNASMSVFDPYMLQDHDLDVDMPELLDCTAVSVPTGLSIDNAFFRCRIGLAHIQGKVYDNVYSARARNSSPEQRAAGLQAIWDMLLGWSATLPGELRLETATEALTWLRFTYFRTICQAHHVHSHDADWIRSLIDYSTRWSTEFDPTLEPAACPLPSQHWTEIVSTARNCMVLFHQNPPTSTICRLEEVCCAYVAALVILVAHKLTIMEHQTYHVHSDSDDALINKGITRLKTLPESSITRRFALNSSIASACRELDTRASAAVAAFDYITLQFSSDGNPA